MKKRIHIYYSGNVQGVGFRFTAESAALDLGVTGWVKNLADGRVEVVGEGEEKKLVDFIDKIKIGPMKNYIKDVKITWLLFEDEFRDFDIRFY